MNRQEKDLLKERISRNLERVRKNIRAASARVNRDPSDIILVAATKTVGVQAISAALDHGIQVLGENRMQEAREKFQRIGRRAEWHFIGHLQRNKVKYLFDIFTLVHSVDSYELAEEISRRALLKEDRVLDILLQVNIGEEVTKYGFPPAVVAEEAKRIAALSNVRIRGLMAVPPLAGNPMESRPYFKRVMEIRREIEKMKIPRVNMDVISFGMSDDYEVAVEEGATHLRIGTAIFGTRDA